MNVFHALVGLSFGTGILALIASWKKTGNELRGHVALLLMTVCIAAALFAVLIGLFLILTAP